MKKEIFINCNPQENRVAVLIDGRLDQFFLERAEDESPLGNIYKGKVTTILPGLGAAFVRLPLEKDGFLPMRETAESSSLWEEYPEDSASKESKNRKGGNRNGRKGSNQKKEKVRTIQQLLRKGQDVIVQVVKEPIGDKGARLTTQISLPGRYLVLMPGEKRIGISKKISRRDQRARIRKNLNEIKIPDGVGLIVRTAALSATKKNLKKDLKYLLNIWKEVQRQDKKKKSPALLHEEQGLVLKIIRDSILTDVKNIVVDSKAEYKKIKRFLSLFSPRSQSKLVHYTSPKPLFEKHRLEDEIQKIFQPKIWLNCGGSLVFKQTEALVAVDVNTGKHKGGKNQEQTVMQANVEAAEEVAKQLRLRNVGGIIVIDFIDMNSRKYQRRVMSTLKKELKKDKAKTRVLPFSEFGLVQMTRQREEESFLKRVYEPCPYCQGMGVIKSEFTLNLEIERKLLTAIGRRPRVKRFRIEAHPQLANHLLGETWEDLRRLARKRKVRLSIIDNADLAYQEFILWALSGKDQEKI